METLAMVVVGLVIVKSLIHLLDALRINELIKLNKQILAELKKLNALNTN